MTIEEYIDDLDYIAGIVKQNKKLINENVQLEQVNKQLKEKIDKAIEKLKEIKSDLDFEPWSIYQVNGDILFDLLILLG